MDILKKKAARKESNAQLFLYHWRNLIDLLLILIFGVSKLSFEKLLLSLLSMISGKILFVSESISTKSE